jgi:hypothetical protein
MCHILQRRRDCLDEIYRSCVDYAFVNAIKKKFGKSRLVASHPASRHVGPSYCHSSVQCCRRCSYHAAECILLYHIPPHSKSLCRRQVSHVSLISYPNATDFIPHHELDWCGHEPVPRHTRSGTARQHFVPFYYDTHPHTNSIPSRPTYCCS